jgi:hypothetical protein
MTMNRPVSIAHLVFGLIFLGATGLWTIGAATDADAPDMAVLAPAVLIGAGVIGLIGIVINARNSRVHTAAADLPDIDHPNHPEYADTGATDTEEHS